MMMNSRKKTMEKRVRIPLSWAFAMALLLTTWPAAAQDPGGAAEAKSPEVEALEEQLALLELQAKIAKAQSDLIDNAFDSATTPLTGTVTADGDVPLEAKVLAQVELEKIADTIAQKVSEKLVAKPPLVVYNEAELDALLRYRAFLVQLNILLCEYERLLKAHEDIERQALILDVEELAAAFESSTGALDSVDVGLTSPFFPDLVGGALKSVIDVLALFRTDTKVTSKDFDLDELALVSHVVDALSSKSYKVYDPARLTPRLLSLESKLLDKLGDLDGRRSRVDAILDKLKKQQQTAEALVGVLAGQIAKNKNRIAEIEKELKKPLSDATRQKLEKEKKTLEEQNEGARKSKDLAERRVKNLKTRIEQLTKVNELYSAFQVALLKTDGDSGINALGRLLKAEKLFSVMVREGSGSPPGNSVSCLDAMRGVEPQSAGYTLLLKILDAGGSTQTSNNLFTGGRLRHSGGAVASFVLYDPEGTVAASGTFQGRSKPKRFKKWAVDP